MISKIINISLVYVLCILNFAILTTPYILIFYPFIHFTSFAKLSVVKFLLVFAFFLSSVMFILWILDFVFSGSVRYNIKRTKHYKHKRYARYAPFIEKIYKTISAQYGINFEILIKESSNIDAYATASFSRKIVVISTGTLSKIEQLISTKEEFESALSGLLAHEASHLLNKDFLPGALLNINKIATYNIAKITSFIYLFILFLVKRIPFVGYGFAILAKHLSSKMQSLLMFFMDRIVIKIYCFISAILTRGIEYRSDADAARIFGPQSISLCLEILAGNSYNSVFSTHPSTHLRIDAVGNIKQTKRPIRQNIITAILNYLSISLIVFLPIILYHIANPMIIYYCIREFFYNLFYSIHMIQYKFYNFFYTIRYHIFHLFNK